MQGWMVAVAVNGGIAVAAGAYAAHGLEALAGPQAAEWARTAATYQMWHALALLGTCATALPSSAALTVVRWAFLLGIVLFCGSLYLMAGGAPRLLGVVTPVGGFAFLVGWVALAVAAAHRRS